MATEEEDQPAIDRQTPEGEEYSLTNEQTNRKFMGTSFDESNGLSTESQEATDRPRSKDF